MPTGMKNSEETKQLAVNRLSKGAPIEELAVEYNVTEDTLRKWQEKLGKPKRRVRRRVSMPSTPKENIRVSQPPKEDERDMEIAFWKDAYLSEFRKNRNVSGS